MSKRKGAGLQLPVDLVKGAVLLLCAVMASYKLELNGPILPVLGAAAALWLYEKEQKQPSPVRARVSSAVYAVLVSLAIVIGKAVHYSGMRDGPDINYIDWGPDSVVAAVALAILLYPAVTALLRLTERKQIPVSAPRAPDRKIFVLMWGIIFLCWTPYLLTFYPAGIVGDGALTLEESMLPGVPRGNHWVVLYILTLRFFLWLGSLVKSDPHFGVFLYALAQSLIFAAACAGVSYKLWKVGTPRWMAWGCVAMYAISGFFASYGMAVWKNGLFSAGVVYLAIQLWELPQKPDWKACLKFSLTALFLCFWRNNGLYVLVLCLLAVLILLRRQGKRILACGLVVAVVTMAIQGPGYDALHIQKDSLAESISIPLQQLAAVISSGKELSPEQEEILYNILPREEWIDKYCPTLSDDLKGNAQMNSEYLETHFGDFLKIWAQLLPENLETYVEAYLMQTLGFWQPGVFIGNYNDYWIGIQDLMNRGWHITDWPDVFLGHSLAQQLRQRTAYVPSGTAVWIMLLSAALLIGQKKCRCRMLVLAPFLASWAVIMVAAPIAYAYRYILMIAIGLPILCVLPFCPEPGAERSDNVTAEKVSGNDVSGK